MARRCCALQADFTCTDEGPRLIGVVDIQSPVGDVESRDVYGNRLDDVRKVQVLLNKVGPGEGGPTAPGSSGVLKVDGLCGPLTRRAVVVFQRKQFPEKPPDGIVDPNQRTLYRLNQIATPELDNGLVAKATAGLATVKAYLSLAIVKASAVLMEWRLDNPLFKLSQQEALLNENFHLDRSTDRVRDLGTILDVYQRMLTVVGHIPRGPNQKTAFGFIAASPLNRSGVIPFAFAYGGGWRLLQGYSGKDSDFLDPVRKDLIYVTQHLMNAHEGAFIYAIVHELAHYVGGRSGDIDAIADRAYFHRQLDMYKRLSAYEATTNADSYAQYVWQVNRGAHFRP